MEPWVQNLVDSMIRRIGQTVTIFTTSGGLSGSGFTGVLVSVDCNIIRLLTDEGAPPACPVGSSCSSENFGPFGGGLGDCSNFYGNPFGAPKMFKCLRISSLNKYAECVHSHKIPGSNRIDLICLEPV